MAAEEHDEQEEEQVEQVLFQGALNGKDANLKANAKLVRAGLVPAKRVISDAIDRRAHWMSLEPKGPRFGVKLMVDGIAYPGGAMPRQRGMAVTQMIKLLAGLDVAERKKPQSGGIKVEFMDVPYELKVESIPVEPGVERVVISIENQKKVISKPSEAGLTEEFRKKFRDLVTHQHGLVIVCGAPQSGTTTTTHVLLHTIDSYLYTVYSFAKEGSRELVNITPFKSQEGHDLEMTVERSIRKEANIIYIDPLTDAETAKTVFGLQSRVAFMCEMPAPNPAAAIQQLIQWIGDPEIVANGLQCVVTQQLIRKLCSDCKEAYRPNPKLLQKIGLPPETRVLYRAPTIDDEDPNAPSMEDLCADCDGVPYHGRIGTYELLEVTEGMKDVIRAGAAPEAIKAQMRKDNMFTLQKDGLRLVAEGVTSLEELQRAFSPPKPRRPGMKKRPRP